MKEKAFFPHNLCSWCLHYGFVDFSSCVAPEDWAWGPEHPYGAHIGRRVGSGSRNKDLQYFEATDRPIFDHGSAGVNQ